MGKELSVTCSKNSHPVTILITSIEVIDRKLINPILERTTKQYIFPDIFPGIFVVGFCVRPDHIRITSLSVNRILTGVRIAICHHTCLLKAILDQVTEGHPERQTIELLHSVLYSVLCALNSPKCSYLGQ
jgi:hypothetical protein